MFQSRNRESYLFKCAGVPLGSSRTRCFNLVIENLIFSRRFQRDREIESAEFQSRNRESYLFKPVDKSTTLRDVATSFNLVIENLIFSSLPYLASDIRCAGFNLVIENLIFSSEVRSVNADGESGFNLVIENLIFSSQQKPHEPI